MQIPLLYQDCQGNQVDTHIYAQKQQWSEQHYGTEAMLSTYMRTEM